ncbi:hypothetical protein [Amycolatopsis thermoflava]|nr:hypothetical protein [Amycolatopsis thermoflava]
MPSHQRPCGKRGWASAGAERFSGGASPYSSKVSSFHATTL